MEERGCQASRLRVPSSRKRSRAGGCAECECHGAAGGDRGGHGDHDGHGDLHHQDSFSSCPSFLRKGN